MKNKLWSAFIIPPYAEQKPYIKFILRAFLKDILDL